ncbi:MAG: hypothetical protein ACD_45C00044G0002 [uncultured bacterium]|nr:MAG: hypothetical protein ACD_45C00044G0002 [uncultured bacterium]OGT57447.1 MAG: protein TolQ [Gammaproteobacteria bacterium RIFCSPHIGHO2_12_FULL_42_10]
MNVDATLFSYFLQASIVVKAVMLILVGASVVSWTYILQRGLYLRDVRRAADQFEQLFWSGEELAKLYGPTQLISSVGLEAVFHAGFKEFQRFKKQSHVTLNVIIENTKRAMHAAKMREQDRLETHLSFLAIVGSTGPYVGLFGTVWGIMQSFTALAHVEQATIAMVAPGIAEALIATALGLFAAIPAVVSYNRFLAAINRLLVRFDAFEEEFINILIRQTQPASREPLVESI